MRPFVYESPSTPQQAISRGGGNSAFIAGGTTLIDLVKLEVMNPSRVVDLNRCSCGASKCWTTGCELALWKK